MLVSSMKSGRTGLHSTEEPLFMVCDILGDLANEYFLM